MNKKILYIDRRDGLLKEEKIYFEKALRFFYGSSIGRFLGSPLARVPFFSHLFGWWQKLKRSKKKIIPFVQNYGIDPSEFEQTLDSFASFDAFFTRKLKPTARPFSAGVMIPADGRYLVYQNISTCNGFVVKGEKFTLKKLLQDEALANRYHEGSMVIARLCPIDYHRFHFPIDCIPSSPKLINGSLFSVNPIAIQQNIHLLCANKRVITHLKTDDYGVILYIEIGATNVGSIHQTFIPNQPVRKGDEKGYFSFGGSSIILLFENQRIQFAADLLKNSQNHIETLAFLGQSLEKNYN